MYYNRDLSWLEFNHRVLNEAACKMVPLYDRIKFLSIFSSNLDEFFSIRYPVILAISNLKTKTQRKIENDPHPDVAGSIRKEIEEQLDEFNNILTNEILPELAANNIILYYHKAVIAEHKYEVREIFLSNVLSFLQPIFLRSDIMERFEPEANKLYMIISLKKIDADIIDHAIIKIPSDHLQRFYCLSQVNGQNYVIFIDDIIRENSKYIFPGFEIVGVYSIKFNRNEDIDFEGDYKGDIVKKIERKLVKRAHGFPSRFLFESTMPRNVQLYIASIFEIEHEELFEDGRYHNLSDLSSLPHFGKQLTNEAWAPLHLSVFSDKEDIFKILERRDILLHFPYQSYNPILSFFNQAAIDPEVEEIYITLYRVAADSLIANALISAARNGKKVVAFIELKARFDEANNIAWSKKMKKAGITIIYSIPGIKVHTKIALIVKRTDGVKKTYSIIGTGNFNEVTASQYTDHILLTTREDINSELMALFRFIEKREKPYPGNTQLFKKILVSQFNMNEKFEKLIFNEIKQVQKTGYGLIRIKLNNLEEPGMINLLYKASAAGVKIQLIVRSICCLIPQVSGLSMNIEVKRIVDRYLEHTRIFIFGKDADAKVIIGSADWMTRNLYHRIEVCAQVTDAGCKKELLDYFNLQWRGTEKLAYINKLKNGSEPENVSYNAQESIYEYLRENS
ncbi:MAG: Polyphosphate kinase [Chitinophagaceae bacterium]|nr:Polyphosphate kinase [Chitinophagaceae bacterium]